MNLPRAVCLCALALAPVAGAGAPVLEIEQVLADGQPIAYSPEAGVVLPAGRHDLEIRFRTKGDTPQGWIVQYQLIGHDPTWRTVDGEMAMIARLLDDEGREVALERVPVPGQSYGPPGVPRRSQLNRRLHPLFVPEGAKTLEITFDSGSWRPELMGEWVIGEVTVNRSGQAFGPNESIWQNPMLKPLDPRAKDNYPDYWERRGDPAITRLEKASTDYLMTLRDFSDTSAGAWVSSQGLPADIKPGDVLTIGVWDQPFVHNQRSHSARYIDVPPGKMLFRAVGRGAGAVYLDGKIALPVTVQPYIWTRPWFVPVAVLLGGGALGLGVWQWARQRYRRKLARLELEARIEKDRMRIARDIHDDVGAQLTRLSLMCTGHVNGATPEQVEDMATASRQIIRSMDEIVWAINPSNDSLDQLGTFLCRFMDEFLEESGVRARYKIPATLPPVPLNAEVRHNLFLAVKEALNNALKYAAAQEIRLTIATTGDALEISVADDGRGFDVMRLAAVGNGLRNMRSRLEEIGGSCRLESSPGGGTRVVLLWPLPVFPGREL